MNIHIFWGILLQRKSLKHIYHSFKQLRHHSLHSAARILFLLHANKPRATTVYFEGHFGNLSSDFRKISGLGLWMVDGMGFLRPCLDGSWVFTDVQNDGIFRPNRTKSSSTSLVFCACLLFLWKLFLAAMAKEKKSFCCLWKTSDVFGATFLCRGGFLSHRSETLATQNRILGDTWKEALVELQKSSHQHTPFYTQSHYTFSGARSFFLTSWSISVSKMNKKHHFEHQIEYTLGKKNRPECVDFLHITLYIAKLLMAWNPLPLNGFGSMATGVVCVFSMCFFQG